LYYKKLLQLEVRNVSLFAMALMMYLTLHQKSIRYSKSLMKRI